MSFSTIRKIMPLLALFIAGALLGKPLALGGIGLFAKAYLFFENGYQFSYGSIDWHDGSIIFSEVDITEAQAFELYAKQVVVFPRARHLTVEKPRLFLYGVPRTEGKASSWTFAMTQGILVLDGVDGMPFTFARDWPHHLGRLAIEKGASILNIEARREGREVWLDADVHRFDLQAIRPWVDLKGQLDGRMHLVFSGGKCQRGSASLHIRQGGYREIADEIEGCLDWEGEIGSGSVFEWLQQSRVHMALVDGSIRGSNAQVAHAQGVLTMTPELGTKWAFEGIGRSKDVEYPVSWTGKSFSDHGIDSEIRCLGSQISLKGKKEKSDYLWEAECRRLSSTEGILIESLYSLTQGWDARCKGWIDGTIDATAKVLYSQGKIAEWSAALTFDRFLYRVGDAEISCSRGEMDFSSRDLAGEFSLSAAAFSVPLLRGQKMAGEGWNGGGRLEKGAVIASCLVGNIEGVEIELEALGTLAAFSVHAEGLETSLMLHGAWQGGRLECSVEEGKLANLSFCGQGWVTPAGRFEVEIDQFNGALSPLYRLCGGKGDLPGCISSIGDGFRAEGGGECCDWSLQARGALSAGLKIYCPLLKKKGERIAFDVHVEGPQWDFMRLCGVADGDRVEFDSGRTHFLGNALSVSTCIWGKEGLTGLQAQTSLSWQKVLNAAAVWFPEMRDWDVCHLQGEAALSVSFEKAAGVSLLLEGNGSTWGGEPIPLKLSVIEASDCWRISGFQAGSFLLSCDARQEGRTIRLTNGEGRWGEGIEGIFEGTIEDSLDFHAQFSRLTCDLSKIEPIFTLAGLPWKGAEGILEGSCHIAWLGKLEADCNMNAPHLKIASLDWENREPLHICYSSESGMCVSGVHLQVWKKEEKGDVQLGGVQINLLRGDLHRSVWGLSHAHVHLPLDFWELFPDRPAALKEIHCAIDLTADIECPFDFSSISWCIKEGLLPFGGVMHQIQNFALFFDESGGHSDVEYLHQGHFVKIHLGALFGSDISGKLVLEEPEHLEGLPLTVDWLYNEKRGFHIRAIEGKFGGLDASFHAIGLEHTLIGSARVHFGAFAQIAPSSLAQVFRDLNMGEGYEIKGCLSIENGAFSFRGLLSGKQLELFGYQFRTLLAQIDLRRDRVRISDLKISDSAGTMKIEELIAQGIGDAPWTISIPSLAISELRPSLLKKVGREQELKESPLVIREMKMEHFHGLLEESSTYTATGEISFVNSYRREHTVFDIPSDFLGRIVGLDLELLIPVCGTFHYELKDRSFLLTDLKNAYSEARRSEFFFVQDPPPEMDLNGALRILVKMKQFVLFKFTESFLISIEGTLDDPQFHLQKKRRFLR